MPQAAFQISNNTRNSCIHELQTWQSSVLFGPKNVQIWRRVWRLYFEFSVTDSVVVNGKNTAINMILNYAQYMTTGQSKQTMWQNFTQCI